MYTIYGKFNCTFCTAAKMLLSNKNIEYEYISLESMEQAAIDNLIKETNRKTVPIIFKDGELIGGYVELAKTFS